MKQVACYFYLTQKKKKTLTVNLRVKRLLKWCSTTSPFGYLEFGRMKQVLNCLNQSPYKGDMAFISSRCHFGSIGFVFYRVEPIFLDIRLNHFPRHPTKPFVKTQPYLDSLRSLGISFFSFSSNRRVSYFKTPITQNIQLSILMHPNSGQRSLFTPYLDGRISYLVISYLA